MSTSTSPRSSDSSPDEKTSRAHALLSAMMAFRLWATACIKVVRELSLRMEEEAGQDLAEVLKAFEAMHLEKISSANTAGEAARMDAFAAAQREKQASATADELTSSGNHALETAKADLSSLLAKRLSPYHDGLTLLQLVEMELSAGRSTAADDGVE